MNKKNLDVLLIQMPFGLNYIPSLALSLLKSSVLNKGFSAQVKYYTLKYTSLIGERLYYSVTEGKQPDLFCDWLFSGTLFDNLPPADLYIKNILKSNGRRHFINKFWSHLSEEESISYIHELKGKSEPFIQSCLEEVLAINPKIVGFTSSFQQNVASLSLAKRIKEHLPETVIIFGGANCEGVMGIEIIKQFPFVDIVVSGEADTLFPELVSKILNKEEYTRLPGVINRENLHLHANGVISTAMITDMDSLPFPDFDDYFDQYKEYAVSGISNSMIFESSRGCWWGEKSHCTFCGLNGNNMAHRSKSSARVFDEIKFLRDKYKINTFSAADNIMDLAYFKDLIPALAREKLNVRIFYEQKSNLTKEQVRLLREANVTHIQPGIESFNTHVLELMKKGVKSIQNIQLLKWCKEYGVNAVWNIIWGFPGETSEDYFEMAALMPKISHLFPPNSLVRLNLHRFSPNFDFPDKFGIKEIIPYPSYHYVYPFDKETIYNLAYQFDYRYDKDENFDLALDAVVKEQFKWKANYQNNDLFFIDQEDALVVFDMRNDALEPYYILYGKERFLYLLCDKTQPRKKIISEYSKFYNQEPNEAEVLELLEGMIDKNLMVRENNSYLSLAIELRNYSPNIEVMKKLITTLKNRPAGDNQVTINDKNELLIELSC